MSTFPLGRLGAVGRGTEIAPSAVIVHPEAIRLGRGVRIDHLAMLAGDPAGDLDIADDTYVGPHCWLQGAGGLRIGAHVGIGAGTLVLTSIHAETAPGTPITDAPLRYGAIEIGDGCDIGIGALLLPGARLGEGVQVGAGAVVRDEHSAGSVIAGVPARTLRMRGEGDWAAGLDDGPPHPSPPPG